MNNKTYHVVFDLMEPEPEKWCGTIKNVDHLIQALGPQNKEGAFLASCDNSLEGKHIPLSSVQASFTVVPSGVAEVVKKQHEGWQYLKAAW